MKKQLCSVRPGLLLLSSLFVTQLVWGQAKASSPATAEAPNYCLAIRGNGELEPAHWGGMAHIIEQIGLPQATAGGSSATVSMFILEAIASNPFIAGQPVEVQKQRASLLLKSLLGFLEEMKKTKTWVSLQNVYGGLQKVMIGQSLEGIKGLLNSGLDLEALKVLKQMVEANTIDPMAWKPLASAIQKGDLAGARFYIQQIQESLRVFGQFNAVADDNIFFRAGLVNFEAAAVGFGKLASFYAAAGIGPDQKQEWNEFFQVCGDSKEKSWIQIAQTRPACVQNFGKLFHSYFAEGRIVPHFENRTLGQTLRSYPSTAVLTGNSVSEFQRAQAQYHQKKDPRFGRSFRISNSSDVKFGYWGDESTLNQIAQSLPSDEKSRRFLSLGSATWKQVLALSPAEPGLAPLKEFTAQDKVYVSAGGWSDLHPIQVLKAAGCQDVVYLTRRGGESLFAQGIAKRLMNLDRDWALLRTDVEENKIRNEAGDPSDLTSNWSRLYNMANPQSAIQQALAGASATLCTNWNDFDLFKGDISAKLVALIEDSYRGSFLISPQAMATGISSLAPVLTEKRPGCTPL